MTLTGKRPHKAGTAGDNKRRKLASLLAGKQVAASSGLPLEAQLGGGSALAAALAAKQRKQAPRVAKQQHSHSGAPNNQPGRGRSTDQAMRQAAGGASDSDIASDDDSQAVTDAAATHAGAYNALLRSVTAGQPGLKRAAKGAKTSRSSHAKSLSQAQVNGKAAAVLPKETATGTQRQLLPQQQLAAGVSVNEGSSSDSGVDVAPESGAANRGNAAAAPASGTATPAAPSGPAPNAEAAFERHFTAQLDEAAVAALSASKPAFVEAEGAAQQGAWANAAWVVTGEPLPQVNTLLSLMTCRC